MSHFFKILQSFTWKFWLLYLLLFMWETFHDWCLLHTFYHPLLSCIHYCSSNTEIQYRTSCFCFCNSFFLTTLTLAFDYKLENDYTPQIYSFLSCLLLKLKFFSPQLNHLFKFKKFNMLKFQRLLQIVKTFIIKHFTIYTISSILWLFNEDSFNFQVFTECSFTTIYTISYLSSSTSSLLLFFDKPL